MDAVKFNPHQTGHFLVTSSKGVKYVFILYSYDYNAILSDPLKSRTGKGILHSYTICHDYLKERVFKPKMHWLYNEASNSLKQYNLNHEMEFQLVPLGVHRQNAANLENYCISVLSRTDPQYPMHLFFCLLKQFTLCRFPRSCMDCPNLDA